MLLGSDRGGVRHRLKASNFKGANQCYNASQTVDSEASVSLNLDTSSHQHHLNAILKIQHPSCQHAMAEPLACSNSQLRKGKD